MNGKFGQVGWRGSRCVSSLIYFLIIQEDERGEARLNTRLFAQVVNQQKVLALRKWSASAELCFFPTFFLNY